MTLKMYDYYTYRPKTLAEMAAQAQAAEAAGFDSVWVMDHVFIQRANGRVHAHDPMLTAACVLNATSRIQVGTLVLGYPFRHVVQLAREASAVADAGHGRFILGLGTGWHRAELDALGLAHDHLVSRLEAGVPALQRMLRGDRASSESAWLELDGPSIAVTSEAPPLWIAAEGPRMLALAARCDGWNHAYWGAEDVTRFRSAAVALRDAVAGAGRSPDDVETSASVACVLDGWEKVPGGFSEPEVAVGSAQELAGVIRDYAAAGAGHVVLSLSPDPYAEIDASALERSIRILELV